MEKCPPAEACRDAFERMSKATVQMCLSTPGFGFSSDKEATTPRPLKRDPGANGAAAAEYPFRQEYTPIAPKPKKKRPPPQFDMDLRGLFPDDLDSNVRPSASFPLQYRQKMQHNSQEFENQAATGQQMSPSMASASNIHSQITTGLGMGQTHIPTLAPSQQYQQTSFTPSSYGSDFMDISTVPGMDFLNMANPAATSSSSTTGNDEMSYEIPGMDLGFGVGNLGLDFQHDWSDGQQFDLFDGFFFGNNAFGGGSGGS